MNRSRIQTIEGWRAAGRSGVLTALALLGTLAAMTIMTNAAPPAGSTIGNQASATYVDSSGTTHTVTSNLVLTTVTQVASVTLDQDLSRTGAPGGQVTFPVTVTNTGNGNDTFNLTQTNGGSFSFSSVTFYADANADGIADNGIAITSTTLMNAGEVFHFVAVGTIPGSALAGDSNSMTIRGTSQFNASVSDTVIDTTTVTGNAVMNVTKGLSSTSGNAGSGPHTVTFTYTNSGAATATNFRITDLLPAGMVYVANSGRWSVTGSTVLTDANNADAQGTAPNTIVYDFGVTALNQVTATISQVLPGQSGTLTFQINISGSAAPGTINNTGNYNYNDGASNVGPFSTNTATFTVNQSAALTFTGATVNSAPQGATVRFTNLLTNNGNGVDSFDIALSGSTFPPGTAYLLYQSNGLVPLVDTNGNGIPDTGPVAAGASYNVILDMVLPPSATGGPFTVNKVATSFLNPTVSATATDRLNSITASQVDLTNNSAGSGAPGAGAGPEPTAVTTLSGNPGSTVRFTLFVNNLSSVADSYDLAASTDSSFGSLTLPSGWSVTFRDSSNAVIGNTGPIAAGGNMQVFADVDIATNAPAAAAPGVQLFFRARSATTGASDRKHDAVVVNTLRSVTLVPNNSGQVFPGSVVVYRHTLTNEGNVTENSSGATIALSTSDSTAGFSSQIFIDANNNGLLDGSDPAYTAPADLGALAPGAVVHLLVRVSAPAAAPSGTADTTTVTATTSGTINGIAAPAPAVATDSTTVINGNVTLDKLQALDANCDGVADGPFGAANISAAPGACIRYQVTATNIGTADVSSVQIDDATPANTTYFFTGPADRAAVTSGSITSEPSLGGSGTITASVGTLTPGSSATLTFGVRIAP